MPVKNRTGNPFDPPRILQVAIDENTEDVEILRSNDKPHHELFKCNACKELRVRGKWPASYLAHQKSVTCSRKERGLEARLIFLRNQEEVRQALIQCGWGPKEEKRATKGKRLPLQDVTPSVPR